MFFFIYVPIFVNQSMEHKIKYQNVSNYLLFSVALVSIIGFFLKYLPFPLFGWMFSSIGLLLFIYYFIGCIKESHWKDYVIGIPFILVFAFCNTSVLFANFAKPEFFESLIAGHIPMTWRTDTLFHSSLAQMINSYNVATTGLNGVPSINYHFGSHFVFSTLANVLNIDMLEFYTLGYPIIFTSLYFYVFLIFILQVKRFIEQEKKGTLGWGFWMLFMATYIGLVKRSLIWDNGLQSIVPGIIGDSGMTTSESYLFSMILLFAFFIMVIEAVQNEIALKSYSFLFIFMPVMVFAIGLAKISTGYIVGCVIVYLFIRYALFKNLSYSLSFGACIIAYLVSYVIARDNSYDSSSDFYFFKNYSISQLIGFFLLFYFWNYVSIALFIFKEKIFSIKSLIEAIKMKRSVLIEMGLVVAIAGIIPIIFLNLGVNGEFFTEVQFFVSIGLVVGYASSMPPSPIWIRLKPGLKKVILIVLFVFLWDTFYSTGHPYMRTMVDVNFEFRKKILNDTSDTDIRSEITRYIREAKFSELDSIISVYGKPVQALLNKNFEYNFLKTLRKLDTISVAQKNKSLIYINYKDSSLKLNLHCFDIVFLAPSLSGIAQLNGMYVEGECDWKGWGFEYYKPRSKEESLKKYSDSELCAEVLKKGFSQLFIYRPEQNDFELLHCYEISNE